MPDVCPSALHICYIRVTGFAHPASRLRGRTTSTSATTRSCSPSPPTCSPVSEDQRRRHQLLNTYRCEDRGALQPGSLRGTFPRAGPYIDRGAADH